MRYLTVFFLLSIMLICFRVNGSDDLHPENFINSMYNADGFKADFFIESILNNKIEIDDKKVIGLLEGLPTKDLQIIRNTVYARHGYIFKNREQLEYFQRKEWYNPQTSNVVLSQDEQDIVTVVKKIEDCENVYFEDFRKLFITLRLPVTYSDTLKRNPIDMLMVRKFLKEGKERNQPYNAIGELHENKDFFVVLYEISSFQIDPIIATFDLNGRLISRKRFFSIGGDITGYTDGKITIDKDLMIHVYISEARTDDDGRETINKKRETYLIDAKGVIGKIAK